MIPRYSRKKAVDIWSDENKFKLWLEVELAVTNALELYGNVPKNTANKIRQKLKDVKFDVAKIDEIEKVTKHDVIAFLTYLNEFIGDDGRFLHLGMTSSDLLDTALNLQLKQSIELILQDLDELLEVLKIKF